MKDLFFASIENDRAVLLEKEFHHAIRVTRHQVGDEIWITDFKGKIWSATISKENAKSAELSIGSIVKEEYPKAIVAIAISPTQTSERTEWFVEKAVECGVHRIYFIQCKRTEVKRVNFDKMSKVVWAAAKQTQRAWLPEIYDLQNFEQFIESSNIEQKFICHCESENLPYLGKQYIINKDAVACIGPAGDFTSEEIQLALRHGFCSAGLGDYRLRTETAGIAALQIFQTILNLKS
jgi:16S rRNA (uracil1498-N3)-methyltransferase